MKKPLAVLVPLVVLFSVFAIGCGSSDDSSDSAPTKAEYITQADAICKESGDELQATIKSTFGNEQPTDAEIVSFTEDEIIPSLEGQLDDLRALTPPESDADSPDDIYNALEDSINTLKDDPAQSTSSDAFKEANDLANAYGMTECGAA